MCGIIGFVGRVPSGMWGQTYSLARELFLSAEHRGRDATGFVAVTDGGKVSESKIVIAKQPLTASEFIGSDPEFKRIEHRRCAAFIGHVRLATHGSAANNRNNHPHVGRRYSLVHNGVVGNFRELFDRHSLRLRSHCDSEVLLRIVEQSSHPALGLETCLREVRGSMAVALYDTKERLVWLARNAGRPLWLARLSNDPRVLFASTPDIIIAAIRRAMGPKAQRRLALLLPVPTDVPTAICFGGRIIAPLTVA